MIRNLLGITYRHVNFFRVFPLICSETNARHTSALRSSPLIIRIFDIHSLYCRLLWLFLFCSFRPVKVFCDVRHRCQTQAHCAKVKSSGNICWKCEAADQEISLSQVFERISSETKHDQASEVRVRSGSTISVSLLRASQQEDFRRVFARAQETQRFQSLHYRYSRRFHETKYSRGFQVTLMSASNDRYSSSNAPKRLSRQSIRSIFTNHDGT